MKQSERNSIIKWSHSLTDAELEKEYYNSVYDSLGSQAEEMYERGYELSDIQEREQYETFISQRCDLLEHLCNERGIKLWAEKGSAE